MFGCLQPLLSVTLDQTLFGLFCQKKAKDTHGQKEVQRSAQLRLSYRKFCFISTQKTKNALNTRLALDSFHMYALQEENNGSRNNGSETYFFAVGDNIQSIREQAEACVRKKLL